MAAKRTFNPRLIKARRSYSFAEVAELYDVHLRTVQRWRTEGLSVDESSRPFLVMGAALQEFLRARQKKRKHPLKPGEFFCPRCRCARRSVPGAFLMEITDKQLGKQCRLAFIRGICEVCGLRLQRFSSDKQVRKFQEEGLTVSKPETILSGNAGASVRADIGRDGNDESKPEERVH